MIQARALSDKSGAEPEPEQMSSDTDDCGSDGTEDSNGSISDARAVKKKRRISQGDFGLGVRSYTQSAIQ